MTFVVIGQDGPNAQVLRRVHRAAHLERIETINAEGRLLLAGPFTDGTGRLIVFTAESETEAADWIAADPYVTGRLPLLHPPAIPSGLPKTAPTGMSG